MTENQRPKFTYLGHSTVRLDLSGGEVVLIDPWIAGNPACPENCRSFERLDAMLITHGHFDHMADAVALAKQHSPRAVVANFEICQWLEGQGVDNCEAMNTGGSVEVFDLKVTMVRADHSSGISAGDKIVSGGAPSGYLVTMPSGYTFYHAGDTALFSDMQLIGEMYRPQLAFLPIGDRFTMDPSAAARACRFLGVREAVPIHWGTFPLLTGTPQEFERVVGSQGINCRIVTLNPGDSY
ncbi:MAG: metal-dependent hydrolase [Acidobacteriota bacterium]